MSRVAKMLRVILCWSTGERDYNICQRDLFKESSIEWIFDHDSDEEEQDHLNQRRSARGGELVLHCS